MKELSIEQKAKRYDEALEKARNIVNSINVGLIGKDSFEAVFPELKESEDEKIVNALIGYLEGSVHDVNEVIIPGIKVSDAIAWLEKQGEQKPQGKSALEAAKEEKIDNTNKAEPKFKARDWVVCGQYGAPCQIESIKNGRYYFTSGIGIPVENVNIDYHLWTIQDAKDGDVLTTDTWIFIFRNYQDRSVYYYCAASTFKDFSISDTGEFDSYYVHPATKEQCKLLFQKMKEAGYEWEAEKKELKKIVQKPTLDIEIPFGTDSELIEEAITIPDGCYAIIEDNKVILRKGEKKSSWSEEDESMFSQISDILWEGYKNSTGEKMPTWDNIREWCLSIKDRVQPQRKQEWSEEDENLLKLSLENLTELKDRFGEEYGKVGDCIVWFESIKDRIQHQTSWKPSDEQLYSLEKATHIVGSKYKSCLNSLYSDLIKLREE